jgi:hypothetical protein
MRMGKSSYFLNRIDLDGADEPATILVEKGVASDSGELAFWCGKTWPEPILEGQRYKAVRPLHIHHGKPVSVLCFPYVPALDKDTETLRREFRSNLEQIASAVADFNGHNLTEPGSADGGALRFKAVRPTRSDLQVRLNLSTDDTRELLRSWDQAHTAWLAAQARVARLPWCLCHNDVSPNNSVHTDGQTTLADFGLACGGPVGSDLHTLIRWSGKAIDDPAHVDGLLTNYTNRIQAYDESISLEQVRLAAWATFFLRYTNLRLSSARYVRVFRLAICQMIEVSIPAGGAPGNVR